MERNELIEILKESEAFLQGHFLLSSGKHSSGYVQCAKVLRYPDKAGIVLSEVVEKMKDIEVDLVVGPAMGGVIVAYELGRQMNKEAIFTEREDNIMKLRRGFEIEKGTKLIIAEDVITTGKSTKEVIKIVEEMGAIVVGVACLVDRTAKDVDMGVPVYSAVKLDIGTYDAEECPMCKDGKEELVKPGSRKIK